MPKRVLFVCTGNSCRSQMAEGLLRQLGRDQFQASSAGLQPSFVNPLAIAVMDEAGIDISHQRSKSIADVIGQPFDFVITLCDSARQTCPTLPGQAKRLHWDVKDPVMTSNPDRLKVFREARDRIRKKIEEFIKQESA